MLPNKLMLKCWAQNILQVRLKGLKPPHHFDHQKCWFLGGKCFLSAVLQDQKGVLRFVQFAATISAEELRAVALMEIPNMRVTGDVMLFGTLQVAALHTFIW